MANHVRTFITIRANPTPCPISPSDHVASYGDGDYDDSLEFSAKSIRAKMTIMMVAMRMIMMVRMMKDDLEKSLCKRSDK